MMNYPKKLREMKHSASELTDNQLSPDHASFIESELIAHVIAVF